MKNAFIKFWKKNVMLDIPLSTSDEEIRKNYELQRENKDWNLYSERTFIENLFCTRFNYFVAILSLLIAATARVQYSGALIVMLFLSAIILTLMGLSVYRIYVKLIIILKILYRMEDYHVFHMVNKEIKSLNNHFSIPVNAIIGVIIPAIGIIVFWIYAIVSLIIYIVK